MLRGYTSNFRFICDIQVMSLERVKFPWRSKTDSEIPRSTVEMENEKFLVYRTDPGKNNPSAKSEPDIK